MIIVAVAVVSALAGAGVTTLIRGDDNGAGRTVSGFDTTSTGAANPRGERTGPASSVVSEPVATSADAGSTTPPRSGVVTVTPSTASARPAVTVAATAAPVSTVSSADSASSEHVLTIVDALATAIELHPTEGFGDQLSIQELLRSSATMPQLLEGLVFDAAGVELMRPLGGGCAVVRASGVAMTVAQVPRTCGPDTVVPTESVDVPWLAAARARIEQIPQHIAERIRQAAFTMVLQFGQQLTAETFASVFHELTFVEEANAPGEVSLVATGTHLAVALRSSTNRCYVMRTEITTDFVTSFGTTEVCTATEADRVATEPRWPAGP